jgi:hypothetical protein
MTDKQYFILSHALARHNAMEAVRLAPNDYAVTIQPKKRSLEANALAHVIVSEYAVLRASVWWGGLDELSVD